VSGNLRVFRIRDVEAHFERLFEPNAFALEIVDAIPQFLIALGYLVNLLHGRLGFVARVDVFVFRRSGGGRRFCGHEQRGAQKKCQGRRASG